MTESRSTATGPEPTRLERIASHWQLFIGLGVVLMALGLAAIAAATLATIVSVLVFGWALIIGGALQAAHAIYQKSWRGRVLDLLTGALFLVAGGITLWRPVTSAVSLTLVLAALLVVRGVFAISAALAHRYPRWGWTVAYGLVSAGLGALIVAQWPVIALWVLGFYVGIELVADGSVALALGLAARRAEMDARGQQPTEARREEQATAPAHEPLPAT